MSRPDDDTPDMTIIHGDLDEPAIDAVLSPRGGAVPARFEDVADLFRQLSAIVEAPAVPPSPDLAAILAHGLPAAASEKQAQTTPLRPTAWRRAHRTTLAVGLSAVIGLPAVGVAAAQDRLPDWAQDMVETLIETTSPFSLPGRDPQARDGSERQETRPSPAGRYEPEPGPAGLPRAATGPATAASEENTDAPDRDGTTAPTGSPQPLGEQRAERDASRTTSDPTTPRPTASATTTSSSSATGDSYPTGDPTGASYPTSASYPTGDSYPSVPQTSEPVTSPRPTGQQAEAPNTSSSDGGY